MKEFQAVFQLSKTIIFEVHYYTLGKNEKPYFTTTAAQFTRNKRDFARCGQAQNELTKGFFAAHSFYQKWDKYHLSDLTQTQYEELQNDLQTLKNQYNYIYEVLEESERPYNPHFSFCRLAEWTKQDPRKRLPTAGRCKK